jgi:preprotein translocase subunit YajC
MLENLKKNDRVITVGGIYGVVVNVAKGSEDITIRVDDGNNTRLRVVRSAQPRTFRSPPVHQPLRWGRLRVANLMWVT